ncbi:MAG: hypothetical protein ACPGSD_14370 [Flavobacteriales bacterium]
MKNVLNLIFFLACLPLFSQEYGELGSTWYYKGYYSAATPSYNEFLKVKSTKDTTININTYHKLERQISINTGIIEPLEPVYIRNSNDTTFLVRY